MPSRLYWKGNVNAGQDVLDYLLVYYKIDKIECLSSVAYVYEDQTDSSLYLEFMLKGHKPFVKHYGPIRVNFNGVALKSIKRNPPTVTWKHLIEEIAFEINQLYIKTPEVHSGDIVKTVSGRCSKCGPKRF